ncbi:hypothetical protein UY3_08824 [Chelonia mydas]|uniref:Uncharacterized protein n=1 Tax=Chelonia mydas TaxID=8469 RepID=M7B7T1_CHEMY|nr:hypothetical protein UY3_08824 [Chelonia mydas]
MSGGKEKKDKMIETEKAQMDIGATTKVQQATVGTQTLKEMVLEESVDQIPNFRYFGPRLQLEPDLKLTEVNEIRPLEFSTVTEIVEDVGSANQMLESPCVPHFTPSRFPIFPKISSVLSSDA